MHSRTWQAEHCLLLCVSSKFISHFYESAQYGFHSFSGLHWPSEAILPYLHFNGMEYTLNPLRLYDGIVIVFAHDHFSFMKKMKQQIDACEACGSSHPAFNVHASWSSPFIYHLLSKDNGKYVLYCVIKYAYLLNSTMNNPGPVNHYIRVASSHISKTNDIIVNSSDRLEKFCQSNLWFFTITHTYAQILSRTNP